MAFFETESPAPVPRRKVRLKTRSSDRYKIAHSSPRNPNFKMESWWDVLPPELQEKILKLKEKMEHQDNMKALAEEIGEFYLQPASEVGDQGDSCCFFLFFSLVEKLAICPWTAHAVIPATNPPSRSKSGQFRCSRCHLSHKMGNRRMYL